MMKKSLYCLVAFALLLAGSQRSHALEAEQGVYQITSADDLIAFATLVNGGSNSADAVVTTDLDMSGKTYCPIGYSTYAYNGTFDGGNHTISNLSVTSNDNHADATGTYVGLFGVLGGGANVKNLVLQGTVSGDSYVGGIAGGALGDGTVTIENCGNEASVTATSVNAAGIIGMSGISVIITNCYNTGAISGEKECAAICGWAGSAEVSSCWNNATVSGADSEKPFVRFWSATFTNCWDTQNVQENIGVISDTSTIATGEFCYKSLNQSGTEDVSWYQTLGSDSHPYPFSDHSTVYANGTVDCTGNESITYSNTEGDVTYSGHTYTDGICSVCGNAYQISTADQLITFSNAVYNESATSAYAELVNDIDLSDKEFLPIGRAVDNDNFKPYSGTFDGQGHKITNMTISTTSNHQGLFGVISDGAYIKNVIVDATCSVTVNNEGYAAGLVGAVTGSGTVTIENCGNEADVTISNVNAAGVIGVVKGGVVKVINCYNTGTIKGSGESAAICGWLSDGSSLVNCWNSGSVEGLDGDNTFYRNTNATATNCYETIGSQVTRISDEDVAGGKLTWLLNEGQTEDVVWYQTIGSDEHPVFDTTHDIVYYINSSYANYSKVFGLSASDIDLTIISGDGGNTYDASSKTITFANSGNCAGWHSSEGIDLSFYDRLVVKIDSEDTSFTGTLRITDDSSNKDENAYTMTYDGTADEISIDLTEITHKADGGENLDLSSIYYVCFTSGADNQTLAISSITLYKKIEITSTKKFATIAPYTGNLDFSGIDGVTAYSAVESDTYFVLEETDKLAAGEGALLHAPDGCTVYVPESESYVATDDANLFVGVTPDTEGINTNEDGTKYVTVAYDGTDCKNYILYNGKLYMADSNSIAAGKAYLSLPADAEESMIKFGIIELDETAGITETDTCAAKNDGVYYNISGMRVSSPGKGLYIVNGKKVVIR